MSPARHCENCGTTHKHGKCPMTGAPPKGRRGQADGNKIPDPNKMDQSACPHNKHWIWTAPRSTGNTFHEKWKYCSKCHYNPRTRDLAKHDYGKLGICECGAIRPGF